MGSFVIDPSQLKKIRTAQGLTQARLASEAGVSQSLIAKIESGEVQPAYISMKSITEALRLRRASRQKKAKDVMSSPVRTVQIFSKLSECVEVMKKFGISQVPVVQDGRALGSITESRILELLAESRNPVSLLSSPIRNFMGPSFPVVDPDTPIEALFSLFSHVQAVVVSSGEGIEGIVAKIDLLAAETLGQSG